MRVQRIAGALSSHAFTEEHAMARSRLSLSTSDDSGHANRPWVYFMIDSFFLITQFFVLTFHLHTDEGILPQKLGGVIRDPVTPAIASTQAISVHVSRTAKGEPRYRILAAGSAEEKTLSQFTDSLARAVTHSSNVAVKVSYDASIPFGDVMGVFNACHKCQIDSCSLVATRSN